MRAGLLGGLGTLFVIATGCTVDAPTDPLGRQQQGVSDPFTHDRARAVAGCGDCDVLNVARLALPETGIAAASAKLRRHDGTFLGVTFDAAGSRRDESSLIEAERSAVRLKRGKLNAQLAKWVTTAAAEQRRWVWLWTGAAPSTAGRRELQIADSSAAKAERDAMRRSAEAAAEPVRKWLAANLAAEHLGDSSGPLLRANLTPQQVKVVEAMPAVLQLGADEYPGTPQSLPWSATSEWGTTLALRAAHEVTQGNGARVCVKELYRPDDVSRVPLMEIAKPTVAQTSSHGRATAGLINNTDGEPSLHLAVAPSAQVYFANTYGDPANLNVNSWCADRATTTLSYSMSVNGTYAGAPSATDMAHDWYAKSWPYMLVVAAAGNVDPGAPNALYVANRGYNGLVVGGADDKNTGVLTDDTHHAAAAWGNPQTVHNDYELPHVAAPSNGADAAGASISGTSAATAMVAGISALVDSSDVSLASWPEAKRAIIIATATTRADLGTRSLPNPGGDAKIGAGVVNAANAAQLSQPVWQTAAYGATTIAPQGRLGRSLDFASDFGADGYLTSRWKARAEQDGRLRVVLTFDSTSNCYAGGPCNSDAPDADLDLLLFKKAAGGDWTVAGPLVCASTTYDSTWEMCDVPVLAGEEYLIAVRKWSNAASWTYMGLAWSQYQLPEAAACQTDGECASHRCRAGLCTGGTSHLETTANQPLEIDWTGTTVGTRLLSDTVGFTVKNPTAAFATYSLFVTASGLDGRYVRRPLLPSRTLQPNSQEAQTVQLSLAPIRSVSAASDLRIEAEIALPDGAVSTVRSGPLYYSVDSAATQVTLQGTADLNYPINWQGDLATFRQDIMTVANSVLPATGTYWDGATYVPPPPSSSEIIIGHPIKLHGVGPLVKAINEHHEYKPLWAFGPWLRVCAHWTAQFVDSNFAGREAIPAAYAKAFVYGVGPTGYAADVWSDYLDENGCTPRLKVDPSTMYGLGMVPRLKAPGGSTFDVMYKSWMTDGPSDGNIYYIFFKTPNVLPFDFDRVQSIWGKDQDSMTNVAYVATKIALTPDNGLTPGKVYKAFSNEYDSSCPACADATGAGANFGSKSAQEKFAVAHEFGHIVTELAVGLGGPAAGTQLFSWPFADPRTYVAMPDGTQAKTACGCTQVSELGNTSSLYVIAGGWRGSNQLHCLQSRQSDLVSYNEGFAQFFANRMFNEPSPTAPCTFRYYKEFWKPRPGMFPALDLMLPRSVVDCRASAKWMDLYCSETLAYHRSTEIDYMGFLYATNVASATKAVSMPKLLQTVRRACDKTKDALCLPTQTQHWQQWLEGAALPEVLGGALDRYRHLEEMGVAYGVNH